MMRYCLNVQFQGQRVNKAFAGVLFCIETAISYVRFVLLSRTSCFDKCPKAFSRTCVDKLLRTNGCATFACFSHTWYVVRLADELRINVSSCCNTNRIFST